MDLSTRTDEKPISMLIQPSRPCNISLIPNKPTTPDVSFSAYLRPADHQVDDSEISIFDAQKYFNETTDMAKAVSRRVSPVNVVNPIPDRYCDVVSGLPRFSSASSADCYSRNIYRARSFHATPTASSEASWNSQTGLLTNPPGAMAVSIRNPASANDEKKKGSGVKWFFRRKCPCSGRKSVQVEQHPSEVPKTTQSRPKYSISESEASVHQKKQSPKTSPEEEPEIAPAKNCQIIPSPDQNRFPPPTNIGQRIWTSGRSFSDGTGFTFPILTHSSSSTDAVALSDAFRIPPPSSTTVEDPPRDSLEVFRPRDETVTPRKLTQRHSFTFPGSPRSRMSTVSDDEVASDASSDLFEIESFSTQTTSNYVNNRRDSLEESTGSGIDGRSRIGGGPGMYCSRRPSLDDRLTESAYEPSEASIDWSVTTAEASVTNMSIAEDRYWEKNSGRGKTRSGSGGGLLSCRCEKAVSVGPGPVRCERQKVGPPIPASATLRHVGSRGS